MGARNKRVGPDPWPPSLTKGIELRGNKAGLEGFAGNQDSSAGWHPDAIEEMDHHIKDDLMSLLTIGGERDNARTFREAFILQSKKIRSNAA